MVMILVLVSSKALLARAFPIISSHEKTSVGTNDGLNHQRTTRRPSESQPCSTNAGGAAISGTPRSWPIHMCSS